MRDGANGSAPLIVTKMCGTNLPRPVVSTGNEMFVKFHSNGQTARKGYEAIAAVAGMYVMKNIQQQNKNSIL